MSATPNHQKHNSLLNNWRGRLDDLLSVKSVDDLRLEIVKLATEVQKEISTFDVNAHLSPEAKRKLGKLEQAYGDVQKSLHKVQKQIDREFNKSLRILKSTRIDAEKHMIGITKKVKAQRARIEQAARKLANTKFSSKKAKVVRRRASPKKAT